MIFSRKYDFTQWKRTLITSLLRQSFMWMRDGGRERSLFTETFNSFRCIRPRSETADGITIVTTRRRKATYVMKDWDFMWLKFARFFPNEQRHVLGCSFFFKINPLLTRKCFIFHSDVTVIDPLSIPGSSYTTRTTF